LVSGVETFPPVVVAVDRVEVTGEPNPASRRRRRSARWRGVVPRPRRGCGLRSKDDRISCALVAS
jgi:hypothetical protein